MKLEMICTGEEVLAGQIVDTNAAWVANSLMEQGIEMQRRMTVGDRLEDLAEVFEERSHCADLIIVNGGLGPTSDDLTAEAMALAQQAPLQASSFWRQVLEARYSKTGRKMPVSNLKQCLLPQDAVLVDNPVGTACGFRVKLNRAWLFFTPGVPHEFKTMVNDQLLPFIRTEFGVQPTVILEKLLCFGHRESSLADRLDQLTLPEGITVGYRSTMPYIEIKVFARGESAQQALPTVIALLKGQLGSACVAHNQPSLAAEVHRLLVEQQQTLSLAESCTGGLLASALIDLPGSSAYLHQGLVTYCNESKSQLLKVSVDTLAKEGAVSIATALEMAKGVIAPLDSDYALATSGVAGPAGGSAEKPVGTVAIALQSPEGCFAQQVQLSGRSRNLVRSLSVAVALDMLRRSLLGEDPIAEYPGIERSQQVSNLLF